MMNSSQSNDQRAETGVGNCSDLPGAGDGGMISGAEEWTCLELLFHQLPSSTGIFLSCVLKALSLWDICNAPSHGRTEDSNQALKPSKH